jgi:hypothetical protein
MWSLKEQGFTAESDLENFEKVHQISVSFLMYVRLKNIKKERREENSEQEAGGKTHEDKR